MSTTKNQNSTAHPEICPVKCRDGHGTSRGRGRSRKGPLSDRMWSETIFCLVGRRKTKTHLQHYIFLTSGQLAYSYGPPHEMKPMSDRKWSSNRSRFPEQKLKQLQSCPMVSSARACFPTLKVHFLGPEVVRWLCFSERLQFLFFV